MIVAILPNHVTMFK